MLITTAFCTHHKSCVVSYLRCKLQQNLSPSHLTYMWKIMCDMSPCCVIVRESLLLIIWNYSIMNFGWNWCGKNKANLRDLIAVTGLILLKLDSNRRFFTRVTLKFDGWPRKIIRHVFYTTSSAVYHFISISELKLKLQSGKAQFGSN